MTVEIPSTSRIMASREELNQRAQAGETVVSGGTGGKSLEAQEHLAEGMRTLPHTSFFWYLTLFAIRISLLEQAALGSFLCWSRRCKQLCACRAQQGRKDQGTAAGP